MVRSALSPPMSLTLFLPPPDFNTTLQDYVNDLEREVDMIGDTITAASPGMGV